MGFKLFNQNNVENIDILNFYQNSQNTIHFLKFNYCKFEWLIAQIFVHCFSSGWAGMKEAIFWFCRFLVAPRLRIHIKPSHKSNPRQFSSGTVKTQLSWDPWNRKILFVISVVKNNTKQNNWFHWDWSKLFVVSGISLYQISLYWVSTVVTGSMWQLRGWCHSYGDCVTNFWHFHLSLCDKY